MWESLKKILGIPVTLLIISWIIFNPYIISVNSPFISNFTGKINDFCFSLNLSYRFLTEDLLAILRFLEYFFFGMISINVFRIYFKNFYQNFINSAFIGLLTAAFEAYYRDFNIYRLEIQDILNSFFEFCIGVLIVYIFIIAKPKKSFSIKHKKSNYVGRS